MILYVDDVDACGDDVYMGEEVDRETKELALRKAVELMRSGAILLSEVCPVCKSPLFRLRSGEVVCPIHGRVILVKTEEEVAEAGVLGTLTELEKRISRVLTIYIKKIDSGEVSYEEARDVVYWLDALERIEKVKNMLRRQVMQMTKKRAEAKQKKE